MHLKTECFNEFEAQHTSFQVIRNTCIKLHCFSLQNKFVTMASVKKSVLMEYLQCTLCMEDMQRSCILQCHHSFCVDCLQKYVAQSTDTQKMTCPICRKVTNLPDGDLATLPPNFFMDNLKDLITKETDDDIDMIEKDKVSSSADREVVVCSLEDCQGEAVMYCTVDQEYLCQTCADEHAAHRFTRKHETISIEEANIKKPTAEISHHPCGLHLNQMLDMYCKTCDKITCYACFKRDHAKHNITSLLPFVKPCEEKLDAIMKRIDKLLKCVHLAKQTSQQQVDKAQHHIVSLKTQVTSTFTQIREKLAQQEEGLMSDLERVAIRVDKVASSTQEEQEQAEINLQSLRFLSQSLITQGDVYDQMSNLPILEEAVEKRWRTEIPGVMWKDQSAQDEKLKLSDVDHLILTEESLAIFDFPRIYADESNLYLEPAVSSEDAQVAKYNVGGRVVNVYLHDNNLFLLKADCSSLHIYSNTGVLIKEYIVGGMTMPMGMAIMKWDDNVCIMISSQNKTIYSLTFQHDNCVLSTRGTTELDYVPWGLSVNSQNNLVVADKTNKWLHIYNNQCVELSKIHLPDGFTPGYVIENCCPGYIVTGLTTEKIIWIDSKGNQKLGYKDLACGIHLAKLRGIVRDKENRCIVTDHMSNQLLLFSQEMHNIICSVLKDNIASPYSLYLDANEVNLYVGTLGGEVLVYNYYKLLGEQRSVKYITNRLDLQYSLCDI